MTSVDDRGEPLPTQTERDEARIHEVLTITDALRVRLTQLSDGTTIDTEHLFAELAEAQLELQSAWQLMQSESQSLNAILDSQRADHWWQRKLIATLPMAVVETEPDGRVVWANTAATRMLERDTLRLVRTPVQSFFHPGDQESVRSILASHNAPDLDYPHRSRAVIRLNNESGPDIVAEVVSTIRTADQGVRQVLTWVLEPADDPAASRVDETMVAHAFSELCLLPLRSGSVHELLTKVAQLCENVCASRSSVSVTIGPPAEPTNLASSSKYAQDIDGAQMQAGEGPCQESWETREIVYSNDLLTDSRWPRFTAQVSGIELGSALAAPVRVGDEVLGVLNVYSHNVDAFDPAGMKIIELLADAAGAIIHHVDEEKQLRQLARQLEEAMRSRQVIEQAKGALMVKYGCTADEAFARLVKVSQNRNVPVRHLARHLVESLARPRAREDPGSPHAPAKP